MLLDRIQLSGYPIDMVKLTGKQIQELKREAHFLNPVVHLGKQGVSDALIQSVDEALTAHELIKIRFIDFKGAKKELSNQLADRTNCLLVTIIGNNAVLYRKSEKEENQKYLK